MNKILTFSFLLIAGVVLLASCRKRDYVDDRTNEEFANVIHYEDGGYPYSIIRFQYDNSYAIIESIDNNTDLWPLRGEQLRGVFTVGRESVVRNMTRSFNSRMYLVEDGLSHDEAYEALYYYDDRYDGLVASGAKPKLQVEARKNIQIK